jgi:DNA-binding transcriptional LysR family regulator
MMDMLENMRTFVRVVEAGSFTAAARRMDTSTGMVSRAVSQLEGHLETRLLQRTTRHLALTESGRRYFERVRPILGDVDEANAEARNALVRPYGRLRVHAMPGLGQRHVTASVVAYRERYADVGVELTLSQRLPNLVEEGYDVSVLSAASLPDSGYIAQPIGMSYSVLVASPAWLARHGVPRTPADLAKHACVGLDTPAAPAHEWRLQGPDGESVHALGEPALQLNEPEALAVALRAGSGIGSLAIYSVIDDLRAGTLVRVLPDYRLQALNVYAVYVSRVYVDARIRTFVEHLRATLGPALCNEEQEIGQLVRATPNLNVLPLRSQPRR